MYRDLSLVSVPSIEYRRRDKCTGAVPLSFYGAMALWFTSSYTTLQVPMYRDLSPVYCTVYSFPSIDKRDWCTSVITSFELLVAQKWSILKLPSKPRYGVTILTMTVSLTVPCLVVRGHQTGAWSVFFKKLESWEHSSREKKKASWITILNH